MGNVIAFTELESSWHHWPVIPVVLLIMVGGSFIKSVITGTVARETTTASRARGCSIFHSIVNVGAFSGQTVVKPLRDSLGNEATSS